MSHWAARDGLAAERCGRAAGGDTRACTAPWRAAGVLRGAAVLGDVAAVLGGGGPSSPP